MIIYLDTNVYCRPFDDQTQERVREETDAFELILEGIRNGLFIALTSDVLQYEITKILSPLKRTEMGRYLALSKKRVEEKEEIMKLGIVIRDRCGIKDRDALHLASAIVGGATYFLICDDELTSATKGVGCTEKVAAEHGSGMKICNPIIFVKKEVWRDKE